MSLFFLGKSPDDVSTEDIDKLYKEVSKYALVGLKTMKLDLSLYLISISFISIYIYL